MTFAEEARAKLAVVAALTRRNRTVYNAPDEGEAERITERAERYQALSNRWWRVRTGLEQGDAAKLQSRRGSGAGVPVQGPQSRHAPARRVPGRGHAGLAAVDHRGVEGLRDCWWRDAGRMEAAPPLRQSDRQAQLLRS